MSDSEGEEERKKDGGGGGGTGAQGNDSSNIIIAIIDNNSWEVGIAEMDSVNPTQLFVSQITDDRTFLTSLQRINQVRPKEILVPDSHAFRPLCEILRNAQQGAHRVTALTRSFFNETKGGELMNELNKTPIQGKQHVQSHYLGRAAACALITYLERTRGGDPLRRLVVSLDPWIAQSKRLQMDFTTVKSLELVANRRTGGREGTLLSVLKRTKTCMGSRLLRGQLISPPAQLDSILGRLDAVEEIVQTTAKQQEEEEAAVSGEEAEEKSKRCAEAMGALSRMCDLDRLCAKFSTEPKGFKVRELKSEIEAVVNARNFSIELDLLLAGLHKLTSEFWKTMCEKLAPAQLVFQRLHEEIGQVTSPPVLSKGRADHHLQDIFCVKADVDGMLDVARLAYVQAVTEMQDLVAALRDSTGIAKIELKRAANRGYHLSVPRTFESRLPPHFVQAVRNKRSILCTTPELASLNNRQARLETEILALTTMRLRPLRVLISDSLGVLLQCSEAVALCDMMFAFAELSAQANYVKPVLLASGSNAEFVLRGARHCVLETLIDEFEPHDLHMAQTQRVLLVAGENCAGKTTYLTQTALCVILAQLGCFVPASHMQTSVFSRLCTRLDTDDALDQNASTFSLEMAETAQILQAVGAMPEDKASLVLIDELGRGTSSRDGLALSCATAEFFIEQRSPVRVLLSTHFSRLKELTKAYPERVRHVTIWKHNNKEEGEEEEARRELDENGGYGIRLAQLCGMPEEVIEQAEIFRNLLIEQAALEQQQQGGEEVDAVAEVFKVLCAIQAKTKQEAGGGEAERDYALARKLLGELRQRIS